MITKNKGNTGNMGSSKQGGILAYMPELPEVETVRQDLDKHLKGLVVEDVVVKKENLIRGIGNIREILVRGKFVGVRRRAKLLIFDLEKDGKELHFVAHLKMTGRFLIRKRGDAKDEYQHITFTLTNGQELRFCDLRQFGYLQIVTEEELKEILAGYGPEPLDDLKLSDFTSRLTRRIAVKKLLLDQAVFSGIGNIYANEALFLAKIHPERLANTLSSTEAEKLFEAVNEVLSLGLKHRGTTTRDESFRDVFGEPGENADNLKVYEKAGQQCLNKCGGVVKKMMVGGRGTYFCENCQR